MNIHSVERFSRKHISVFIKVGNAWHSSLLPTPPILYGIDRLFASVISMPTSVPDVG